MGVCEVKCLNMANMAAIEPDCKGLCASPPTGLFLFSQFKDCRNLIINSVVNNLLPSITTIEVILILTQRTIDDIPLIIGEQSTIDLCRQFLGQNVIFD
jgi:hypothetical protein